MNMDRARNSIGGGPLEMLVEFDVPSQPGNEREAASHVLAAVEDVPLSTGQRQRLETAVAEATMNAMEHGNHYQADVPVKIQVLRSDRQLVARIIDDGGGTVIPLDNVPDLYAKLAGQQSPRGWGLFLIKNMVDEMDIRDDGKHHTVELIIRLGEPPGR